MKSSIRTYFLLLCAVAPLALCLSSPAASSPFLIPYQGRLTNPQGVPYTNGQYTISFTLYDQPVGGTVKWGPETHYKVGVINGMVNVFLGSINTLSNVDFSETRHLGITIYADNNPNNPAPEMVPRQMIIPSFWAKQAENSAKLLGHDWSDLLVGGSANPATGTIRGNKIENQGISTGQIAPGAIDNTRIASNGVLTANIADGQITTSKLSSQLVMDSVIPPGTIQAFGGNNTPAGWLLCDGTALSSAAYPRLYAAISTNWGGGFVWNGTAWAQGTNDFNLPDLRGVFLRGLTGAQTNAFSDPDLATRTSSVPGGNSGNRVGSYQPDAFMSHIHGIRTLYPGQGPGWGLQYSSDTTLDAGRIGATGGNETRPKNAYVNYIIKY